MSAPVIELRNVSKRFGGIVALRGVDFVLGPGEVHALCGENGAGKSTLIKILSGVHPAGSYDGDYLLCGDKTQFASVRDSQARGISVIYQELPLCEELSVAENIFLGSEPRRTGAWPLRLLIDEDRMRRESKQLLARFGIVLEPDRKVRRGHLPADRLLHAHRPAHRTEHGEPRPGHVRGNEERQALNVIPVGVADQKVRLATAFAEGTEHHLFAEAAQAGAGIEDEPRRRRILGRGAAYFNAARVAAVALRVWPGHRV